jgi:hypothetical protein
MLEWTRLQIEPKIEKRVPDSSDVHEKRNVKVWKRTELGGIRTLTHSHQMELEELLFFFKKKKKKRKTI